MYPLVLLKALSRRGRAKALGFALLLVSAPAPAALFDIFAPAPKGSLMIVGGGDTPPDVQEKFVALAGGRGRAKIAILPMASTAYDEEAEEVADDFQQLGADAQIVNFNREDAQNAATARMLDAFTAYWFTGGDQTRLSSTLIGTAALDVMARRYRNGAAIGGTSAGAAVMSGVMLTGRLRKPRNDDEEELANIARGMMEVSTGFGFIKGAIVDQHFMNRARYNRLLSAVLDHPQLLGVGIDEETALLVRPDGLWEVLGSHYVKIFDARRARIIDDADVMAKASDIRMHVLPAGSTYNARSRKAAFAGGRANAPSPDPRPGAPGY